MTLNETYWDDRYKREDIAWDMGTVSPPLKAYFDQLTIADIKILIPGGGHSYEAEYLHLLGFKNVFVADLSKTALENIVKRVPTFPTTHLIHGNFFDLDMSFDLIIEQTFFCALDPSLRAVYVTKSSELLADNGKVVGLLFDAPLNTDKPPFGGTKSDYIKHFKTYFDILTMSLAYNSNPKRQGQELFFIAKKK